MKLVGQARYFWSNVERLLAIRRQEPVRTWEEIRAKLNQKYLPICFRINNSTSGVGLIKGIDLLEYIETFNEFLT